MPRKTKTRNKRFNKKSKRRFNKKTKRRTMKGGIIKGPVISRIKNHRNYKFEYDDNTDTLSLYDINDKVLGKTKSRTTHDGYDYETYVFTKGKYILTINRDTMEKYTLTKVEPNPLYTKPTKPIVFNESHSGYDSDVGDNSYAHTNSGFVPYMET